MIDRIVVVSQAEQGADLATVIDVLDAAMVVLFNTFVTAPPAGYQENTIRLLGPMSLVFDGTNYNAFYSFTYQTSLAT